MFRYEHRSRLTEFRTRLSGVQLEDRVTPAFTFTWTGAGADNSWLTPANWSIGGGQALDYPSNDDTAIFNGTGVKDVSVTWFTVANVSISAGYTGTLTIPDGGELKVTNSFTMAGGKFKGAGAGSQVSLWGQAGAGANTITAGTFENIGLTFGAQDNLSSGSIIDGTITLTNSDINVVEGDQLNWQSGSINMSGSGTVYNAGDMLVNSSGTLGGTVLTYPRLTNAWNLTVYSSPTVAGGFENRSSFVVRSGANTTITGSALQTAGSTELRSGTVTLSNSNQIYNVNGGGVTGNGTLDGNLALGTATGNESVYIAPGYSGAPIGTITITKSMEMFSSNASMSITVDASGNFDKVAVSGWAHLKGSLIVNDSTDYKPPHSTVVPFLTSNTFDGTDFGQTTVTWIGSWVVSGGTQPIVWKLVNTGSTYELATQLVTGSGPPH